MKILFIISSLGSGGAERVLVNIANELDKRGYGIVVATFSTEDSFYELNPNIKHKKLNLLKNSKNRFESMLNTLKRILVLKQFIKKENPDIVISFMTHTNILSTIAAKIARKKIIISERIAYDYYESKMLNIIRRFVYPLSDALVTQTYADLKNYSFLKHSYVIYNPIKTESFEKDIKKQNIVLGVGRLDKQKGFDVLIKAFHQVGKDDWKLIIVGEGSERKRLEKLIKELEVTNIELIGRTKEIFKWYRQASIFVLSSKREGFPNVLIEAMSMGCAVISFDCPYGPGEIIENYKNGLLVRNQNKEELKNAIELLIKNKELREYLSKNAIEVRKKYNIKKIADEWEKIIKEVCE